MLAHVALASLELLGLPAGQGKTRPEAPPATVWIEGGGTQIGSTVDEVEALGRANPACFEFIVCETPRFEMKVRDFFLMTTEVTNEQYAAYVRATGAQPPEHWGARAIDEAGQEFVRDQEDERTRAIAEGRAVRELLKCERSMWWRAHSRKSFV
jgi:formylglycine-generating enzyme required for sulfatase activity